MCSVTIATARMVVDDMPSDRQDIHNEDRAARGGDHELQNRNSTDRISRKVGGTFGV